MLFLSLERAYLGTWQCLVSWLEATETCLGLRPTILPSRCLGAVLLHQKSATAGAYVLTFGDEPPLGSAKQPLSVRRQHTLVQPVPSSTLIRVVLTFAQTTTLRQSKFQQFPTSTRLQKPFCKLQKQIGEPILYATK